MNPLDILRSSGGTDVEIPTIELSSSAWADSIFVCAGYFDQTFTLEDSRVITFQATGMDATLPKKDNQGSQVLGVAIDSVRGEAQRRLDAAKAAGAKVTMTYRLYLDSDHSAPAESQWLWTFSALTLQGLQWSCKVATSTLSALHGRAFGTLLTSPQPLST